MDRNYWEKIAPDYNEQIFDVFQNDKSGIIRSAIAELSKSTASVVDIGCAVGKWIPFLSTHFKKVIATDISSENIKQAEHNGKAFQNVSYLRLDMSDPKMKLKQVDVGICINAILTSSLAKRIIFFQSLAKCIKKGGYLVLVVPSFESAAYTGIINSRWRIDSKPSLAKSSNEMLVKKLKNIEQGNIDIDGYSTKHYLKEELALLLSQEKFDVLKTEKVEYSWKTEFINPPKWLKAPYPWDWLCVAKKR